MTNIDLSNKLNVFEYTVIGANVSNHNNYNIIIEPGDININILGIHFSLEKQLCNLSLNEDVQYTGIPKPTYTPVAHNRYYIGDSKIIIGSVSGNLKDNGKILFNRSTLSEWKTENYELQGWTLNKYKKYAFVINTNGPNQVTFNFSFFWTETESQQVDNSDLLSLHPSSPASSQ